MQREPCYQEPVSYRFAAHLALGQDNPWEEERQALQAYEVAVLAGWENWELAVVGSGL